MLEHIDVLIILHVQLHAAKSINREQKHYVIDMQSKCDRWVLEKAQVCILRLIGQGYNHGSTVPCKHHFSIKHARMLVIFLCLEWGTRMVHYSTSSQDFLSQLTRNLVSKWNNLGKSWDYKGSKRLHLARSLIFPQSLPIIAEDHRLKGHSLPITVCSHQFGELGCWLCLEGDLLSILHKGRCLPDVHV